MNCLEYLVYITLGLVWHYSAKMITVTKGQLFHSGRIMNYGNQSLLFAFWTIMVQNICFFFSFHCLKTKKNISLFCSVCIFFEGSVFISQFLHDIIHHISSYSFHQYYSIWNLEIQRSQYIRPKDTVHKLAETIWGNTVLSFSACQIC